MRRFIGTIQEGGCIAGFLTKTLERGSKNFIYINIYPGGIEFIAGECSIALVRVYIDKTLFSVYDLYEIDDNNVLITDVSNDDLDTSQPSGENPRLDKMIKEELLEKDEKGDKSEDDYFGHKRKASLLSQSESEVEPPFKKRKTFVDLSDDEQEKSVLDQEEKIEDKQKIDDILAEYGLSEEDIMALTPSYIEKAQVKKKPYTKPLCVIISLKGLAVFAKRLGREPDRTASFTIDYMNYDYVKQDEFYVKQYISSIECSSEQTIMIQDPRYASLEMKTDNGLSVTIDNEKSHEIIMLLFEMTQSAIIRIPFTIVGVILRQLTSEGISREHHVSDELCLKVNVNTKKIRLDARLDNEEVKNMSVELPLTFEHRASDRISLVNHSEFRTFELLFSLKKFYQRIKAIYDATQFLRCDEAHLLEISLLADDIKVPPHFARIDMKILDKKIDITCSLPPKEDEDKYIQ